MNMRRWSVFLLVLSLLLTTVSAAAEYDLLPLDDAVEDEQVQPADVADAPAEVVDAPADGDCSPEEAMGALTEPAPDSEWEPPYRGEAGRGDVTDPDKYWATYGYPDFVSYAFEAGGEVLDDGTVEAWWEIGLVGGAAQEEKVLALVAPTCRVQFFPCARSYDQRQALLDEILAREDPRITRAILGMNTERIFVWTSEADRDAVQAELDAAYGPVADVLDSMIVEDTLIQPGMGLDAAAPIGGAPGAEDHTSTPAAPGAGPVGAMTVGIGTQEEAASPLPWVLLAVAVLLGLGTILLHRRQPAAVTVNGDTVRPATRAAVAQAIRETTQPPDPRILTALRAQLHRDQ